MKLVKSGNSIFEVTKETAKTYSLIEKTSYNKENFRGKKKHYEDFKLIPLTKENAKTALIIIKISNMEWGVKPFHFNSENLTNGKFAHSFGRGSNSAILFEHDFKFWAVVSFN